jgi:hypothetical protein
MPQTGVLYLRGDSLMIRPDDGGFDVRFRQARFRAPRRDARPGVRVEFYVNRSECNPVAEEAVPISLPPDPEPTEFSTTPPQR